MGRKYDEKTGKVELNESIYRCYEDSELKPLISDLQSGHSVCNIHLFEKEEPTKEVKILEGRPRLISNVSCRDAHLGSVVFSPLVNAFHRVFPWIGQRDADHRQFAEELLRDFGLDPSVKESVEKFNSSNSSDCSSFDWTVVPEDALFLYELFIRAFGKDSIEVALLSRWFSLGGHVVYFVLPDGTRIKQLRPGIMKSGCTLTLFLNSLLQLAYYLDAGGKVETGFICQGDDAKYRFSPPGIQELYERRGKIIDVHGKDFCSRKMIWVGQEKDGFPILQNQNENKTTLNLINLYIGNKTLEFNSSKQSLSRNFAFRDNGVDRIASICDKFNFNVVRIVTAKALVEGKPSPLPPQALILDYRSLNSMRIAMQNTRLENYGAVEYHTDVDVCG